MPIVKQSSSNSNHAIVKAQTSTLLSCLPPRVKITRTTEDHGSCATLHVAFFYWISANFGNLSCINSSNDVWTLITYEKNKICHSLLAWTPSLKNNNNKDFTSRTGSNGKSNLTPPHQNQKMQLHHLGVIKLRKNERPGG